MNAVTMNPNTGFIQLGPATPSAIIRMANYTQYHLNAGLPIPRSRFAQFVANRITDPADKQMYLISVSGPIGSGKSYTCLHIAERISEEVALIRGGIPADYFNPDNNVIALEDAQNIASLMSQKNKYNVILVDDSSVGLSNHDWNSKSSKAFMKVAVTMRVRRWCVIFNAPQLKNLDNSLRDLIQCNVNIVGSYHKGGFNLCRINTSQIAQSGKTYHHKLSYSGHKIDLWASLAPKKDTVEKYDKIREESAIRLNERVAETGSANQKKVYTGPSRAELNAESDISRYGEAAQKAIAENPQISMRGLAAKICLSGPSCERMLNKMGISLVGRPPGRPKKNIEV